MFLTLTERGLCSGILRAERGYEKPGDGFGGLGNRNHKYTVWGGELVVVRDTFGRSIKWMRHDFYELIRLGEAACVPDGACREMFSMLAVIFGTLEAKCRSWTTG